MSPRIGESGSAALKNEEYPEEDKKGELVNLAEYREDKENKESQEDSAENVETKKPADVEALKAEVASSGENLAQAEESRDDALEKIKKVLPDAKMPDNIATEGKAQQAEHAEKVEGCVDAMLAEGKESSEALIFKAEAKIDVNDAKTESRAKKIGGAIVTGIGKVGEWMSGDPGKKIMTGVGFVATAIGGPVAIGKRLARGLVIKSPEIAKKLGAKEDGKIVSGLEKAAKFTKEASAVGVGKRATGLVEGAQAKFAEKKAKQFEAMPPKEQAALLEKFDGSTMSRLEKIMTSKKTAIAIGIAAGVLVTMMAGSAMGSILEGNIPIPTNIHEHVADSIPNEQVAAAAEQHADAASSAGQTANKGSFKFSEIRKEHHVDGNIMEKAREADAANFVKQAKEAMQASTGNIHENVSDNVEIKHEDLVKDTSPMEASKPKNDIASTLNSMKKPIVNDSHFEHNDHPIVKTPEAAPVPHEQVVQASQEKVVSAEPKAAQVAENHAHQPEKQPMASHKEAPLGSSFDARKVVNLPGAEKISIDVLKENPLVAEKLERFQGAAQQYLGQAGKPQIGETWDHYAKRVAQGVQKIGIDPDKLINRVI